MRVFCAIFIPCLAFFSIDRIGAGLLCLLLQCTIIGWPIASAWALYEVSDYETDIKMIALKKNIDKKLKKHLDELNKEQKKQQEIKKKQEDETKKNKNMY